MKSKNKTKIREINNQIVGKIWIGTQTPATHFEVAIHTTSAHKSRRETLTVGVVEVGMSGIQAPFEQ